MSYRLMPAPLRRLLAPFILVLGCGLGSPQSEEHPLTVSSIGKSKTSISERHRLASLPIWRDNKTEWMTYTVKTPSRGYTFEGHATVSVKPLPTGSQLETFQMETSRFVQGEVGSIYHQSELRWSWATELLEQALMIRGHMPGGVYARKVVPHQDQYQWTETLPQQGAETKSGTLKSPVFLEESVFLELRDWPLEKGFVKEIWWYPIVTTENPPKEAIYARVEVVGGSQWLRDIPVWQVRIKPASGRAAEIFIQSSGTHPVIEAKLSDGSIWSLQTISRR
jgi:hypothetical protein